MDLKVNNDQALALLKQRMGETHDSDFQKEIADAMRVIDESGVFPFNNARLDAFKISEASAKTIYDGYYVKLRVITPAGCNGWGEIWVRSA